MKKSVVWIVAAAGFILVMGGAVVAYNHLATQYEEMQRAVKDRENGNPDGDADVRADAGADVRADAGADTGSEGKAEGRADVGTDTGSEGKASEDQEQSNADPVMAVDFTMLNMDGESVSLSDYYGKPTVLNFWASWCGPCQMEMPYFDAAYKEYGDSVNFVIVNLTDGDRETVESAKEFVETAGYEFPVCFDTEGKGMYAYGVMSIPMTFFINEQSEITGYRVGALTEDALMGQIESMLK